MRAAGMGVPSPPGTALVLSLPDASALLRFLLPLAEAGPGKALISALKWGFCSRLESSED